MATRPVSPNFIVEHIVEDSLPLKNSRVADSSEEEAGKAKNESCLAILVGERGRILSFEC